MINETNEIDKRIQNVIQMKDSIIEQSKAFISELSTEEVFQLISFLSDYNLKLNQIDKHCEEIQQISFKQFNSQQIQSLQNQIDKLEKDIDNIHDDLKQIQNLNRNSSDNDSKGRGEGEDDEDENEMLISLDSETKAELSHKVRFSNNIVRFLRGPLKSMVHGTMHAVDVCAQGTKINQAVFEAVQKGLKKQKDNPTDNNLFKETFADIDSNWTIEGENPDRGYSSPSIWFRNPLNERILIKIQEHPLCAANEWLAYVLGRTVNLPVNEVQIGIYDNHLVTLHRDVQNQDEKTITFMNLPKLKRDQLLKHPIMISIDIFDFFIQNVDRNQQNILITIPKSEDINNENLNKFKIHLIDHASSFGMGKLNAISLVAAKFHSKHLAVAKFNPVHKSKQFELYLNKLATEDRPATTKILNHFASITDQQIDNWITQIQDLLSSSQYNRIYSVLIRQRNIAKHYANQWNTSSTLQRSLSPDAISHSSDITLF